MWNSTWDFISGDIGQTIKEVVFEELTKVNSINVNEGLDVKISSIAGAEHICFNHVRGKLRALINRPHIKTVRQVEVNEAFDLNQSDIEVLNMCQDSSPITVIGIGDGSSAEQVIQILASSQNCKSVERLVLYLDSYLQINPSHIN